MKTPEFTEAQSPFALHQAEAGTKVKEVCRKMGTGFRPADRAASS